MAPTSRRDSRPRALGPRAGRRALSGGRLGAFGLVLAVACGGAADPAGAPAPSAPPAPRPAPVTASPDPPAGLLGGDHARLQRLNAESLRLMIEAATRELEIGPFQDRINAATTASMRSMKDAADQMERVVADLEAALGR